MKVPFIIYMRAIGIYALVSVPALSVPIIYFISFMYVLIYGWFAWGLFTLIYLVVSKIEVAYKTKLFLLLCGVVVSVAFAFQMLEILGVERNIWSSGIFLLFPVGAIIAGWTSVFVSEWKNSLFYDKQDFFLDDINKQQV